MQQVHEQADPYIAGKLNSQCDKNTKLHLTQMQKTVAQNAAERGRNEGEGQEKPLYNTTKDLHYPMASFHNASHRQQRDVPDYQKVHQQMKTQSYKVTAQGFPVPLQNSIKQQDFVPRERVKPNAEAPLPARGNQEQS